MPLANITNGGLRHKELTAEQAKLKKLLRAASNLPDRGERLYARLRDVEQSLEAIAPQKLSDASAISLPVSVEKKSLPNGWTRRISSSAPGKTYYYHGQSPLQLSTSKMCTPSSADLSVINSGNEGFSMELSEHCVRNCTFSNIVTTIRIVAGCTTESGRGC